MANASTKWFDRCSVLEPSFYARDTLTVAKSLLGKILVVKVRGAMTAARIVEVEAYTGNDPAAHSFRGRTPRSAPMFEHPGRAYVYFIYGMYEMLNFVTEHEGHPGAVLIRAGEPLQGEAVIKRRRKGAARAQWTNGPGRLCRALGVPMSYNRESLQGPKIWVLDDGFKPESISTSPRVGIRQAVDRPWRFFITGNSFVSRVKENRGAFV